MNYAPPKKILIHKKLNLQAVLNSVEWFTIVRLLSLLLFSSKKLLLKYATCLHPTVEETSLLYQWKICLYKYLYISHIMRLLGSIRYTSEDEKVVCRWGIPKNSFMIHQMLRIQSENKIYQLSHFETSITVNFKS